MLWITICNPHKTNSVCTTRRTFGKSFLNLLRLLRNKQQMLDGMPLTATTTAMTTWLKRDRDRDKKYMHSQSMIFGSTCRKRRPSTTTHIRWCIHALVFVCCRIFAIIVMIFRFTERLTQFPLVLVWFITGSHSVYQPTLWFPEMRYTGHNQHHRLFSSKQLASSLPVPYHNITIADIVVDQQW